MAGRQTAVNPTQKFIGQGDQLHVDQLEKADHLP
jgi:hypothetical protein